MSSGEEMPGKGRPAGPARAVPVSPVPVFVGRPEPRRTGTAWAVVKVLLLAGLLLMLAVSVGLNILLLSAAVGGGADGGRVSETTISDLGTPGARERVAVIDISGVIDARNVERWSAMLARARRDRRVRAVVLAVNSPGGAMSAADRLYRQVQKLCEGGKTVVVSMGALATSGGYYISMPAQEILAAPTTITGSIGVMMPHINVSEFLEKHGVKDETFVARGSHKKYAVSWTRRTTPEGRQMIQAILDDAYERFVKVVVKGRTNLTENQVRSLADGSVYTAAHALESGLVDGIGYLEDAVARAVNLASLAQARVVRYTYHEPFSLRGLIGIEARPAVISVDPTRLPLAEPPEVLYLWPGWSEGAAGFAADH